MVHVRGLDGHRHCAARGAHGARPADVGATLYSWLCLQDHEPVGSAGGRLQRKQCMHRALR
eukprot:12898769-Alexandrium_andersonii.AAC.1